MKKLANHNPELRCVICTGVNYTFYTGAMTYTALLSVNQNLVMYAIVIIEKVLQMKR